MRRRCLTWAALLLGAGVAFGGAVSSAAAEADYPTRTITLVVPFAAGGSTDVLARLLAGGMSKDLGQQVIVENVAGAGGGTRSRRVAAASPDGYTLLIGNTGTLAANVGFYKSLSRCTRAGQRMRAVIPSFDLT